MTTPAEAAAPSAPIAQLKRWVVENTHYAHPVRTELARAALSALARRVKDFGFEQGFTGLGCQDLLQMMVMLADDTALAFAGTALARAVVEDDGAVVEAFRRTGVAPDMLGWLAALQLADPAQTQALLAGITDQQEELHVARLVVARRHPALIQADWLFAVPVDHPALAARLGQAALAGRADLVAAVAALLRQRRPVLFAIEPDELLAPLVLRSPEHPQTTLTPFEGCFGEQTVCAAAEWHLEHGEPRPALELCGRIRRLSRWSDRALLVAGLASLELGEVQRASALRREIGDPSLADALAVRLGERDPAQVADAEVVAIADRCVPAQPERFFACLKLLLARRDLPAARALCGRHRGAFPGQEALGRIMGAILGEGGA